MRDNFLLEIGVHGPFFTWSNKQEGINQVFSKIDRILCNDDRIHIMGNTSATFLTEGISDHCPCVIKLDNTMIKGLEPLNTAICGVWQRNLWAL